MTHAHLERVNDRGLPGEFLVYRETEHGVASYEEVCWSYIFWLPSEQHTNAAAVGSLAEWRDWSCDAQRAAHTIGSAQLAQSPRYPGVRQAGAHATPSATATPATSHIYPLLYYYRLEQIPLYDCSPVTRSIGEGA